VLGFVISPNGVVAKLVLSWVDLTTVSLLSPDVTLLNFPQHVVHVVHPACDTYSHKSPALPVFDFASPVSALRFSQLVINLSSHFAIISEYTIASCENNKLDWRLDTAEIPSENFETWRDRVAHWIRDIET
jgi:hypothetical protein